MPNRRCAARRTLPTKIVSADFDFRIIARMIRITDLDVVSVELLQRLDLCRRRPSNPSFSMRACIATFRFATSSSIFAFASGGKYFAV